MADLYLAGDDPLHRWALARTMAVQLGDHSLRIAPAEYVILRKLESYREGGSEKHLRDIRGMLQLSAHRIDRGEIDRWAGRLGLEAVWASVATP